MHAHRPPKLDSSASPRDRDASARGRAYGVAVELAGSIIGMGLIGWLIDSWLVTSPRWTLILTAVGALGGFYNFFKRALALNREQAAAYKRAHTDSPSRLPATGSPYADTMFGRSEGVEPVEAEPGAEVPPEGDDLDRDRRGGEGGRH